MSTFYIDKPENLDGAGFNRSRMNRVLGGTVLSVDSNLGIIQVQLDGVGTIIPVELSFDAFSLVGSTSSWFRYMPQQCAAVRIGFRPNGKPELLRYSPINYGDLSKLKTDGKFKPWRTLSPGEFDLRSAGGAGFYATSKGDLDLYAGPTQMVLSSDNNEMRTTAGLAGWAAGYDQLRFGTVKRHFTGPLQEEHQAPVLGSVFKEFMLYLTNLSPMFRRVLIQFGDIFDPGAAVATPLIEPEFAAIGGGTMTGRLEFYDSTGITSSSIRISKEGDILIGLSELATVVGLKIVGLLNRLLLSFLIITIQAVQSIALIAGDLISIDAVLVRVGTGTFTLVTDAAIPLLINHEHPVVTDPITGIGTAAPSSTLTGLTNLHTTTLRSS